MKLTNKDKLVIIDMINGFAYEGALSSPNVANLIPKMKVFIEECIQNGVEIVHYTDWHPENAREFEVYPPHCIMNTYESEVVKELDFSEIRIIHKNSTNGFLTENPFNNKNIYIIGCVTDICVNDFTLTAIKYVQENELNLNVTVIENLCATFDAPNHDAIEVHNNYINKFKNEGVKIVSI